MGYVFGIWTDHALPKFISSCRKKTSGTSMHPSSRIKHPSCAGPEQGAYSIPMIQRSRHERRFAENELNPSQGSHRPRMAMSISTMLSRNALAKGPQDYSPDVRAGCTKRGEYRFDEGLVPPRHACHPLLRLFSVGVDPNTLRAIVCSGVVSRPTVLSNQ